jgi:hypothetical protein
MHRMSLCYSGYLQVKPYKMMRSHGRSSFARNWWLWRRFLAADAGVREREEETCCLDFVCGRTFELRSSRTSGGTSSGSLEMRLTSVPVTSHQIVHKTCWKHCYGRIQPVNSGRMLVKIAERPSFSL